MDRSPCLERLPEPVAVRTPLRLMAIAADATPVITELLETNPPPDRRVLIQKHADRLQAHLVVCRRLRHPCTKNGAKRFDRLICPVIVNLYLRKLTQNLHYPRKGGRIPSKSFESPKQSSART